jgi:glutamine amidotransferase-like uncharacterized protein
MKNMRYKRRHLFSGGGIFVGALTAFRDVQIRSKYCESFKQKEGTNILRLEGHLGYLVLNHLETAH